jgi:hypothetical protein
MKSQVQESKEEELVKYSIEDSDHETLIERGLIEVSEGLRDWLQEYWEQHKQT